METSQDDQERTFKDGDSVYSSSLGPCEEKIRARFFHRPHQDLLLIRKWLQELQGIVSRDHSLVRFFQVLYMSDALAQRMPCMFTDPRPKILEACSDDISWVDVVRESSPEVKYQEGKYHCDRGGTYRDRVNAPEGSKRRTTTTRRIGCPFELYGKKLLDDKWILNVQNGDHNHAADNNMVGHSAARRLTEVRL